MRAIFRTLLGCVALVTATAALAACGSGSGTSSTSTSTAATAQQRAVAALTQFAHCMRTHGVPVPDPNSQGQITGANQLQQQYQNTPQGQAALSACHSYLQNAFAQLTPANTQQYRHAQLLFARCMRAHGVAVPDPDPNGEINLASRSIDKASPQFQTAAQSCAYLRQSAHQIAIGG